MTTLMLARHTETDWNARQILAGSTEEASLTEKGKEQAEVLSKKLASFHIDKIYCSAQKRARQAVEVVNKNLKKEIVYSDRFNERHWGQHEGKKNEELEKIVSQMSKEERLRYKPIGGESQLEFQERVRKGLNEIVEQNPEKVILILSHDGVVKVMRQLLKNLQPGEHPKLSIATMSLDIFQITDGKVIEEKIY